jgi:hypothetical protein
MAGCVLQEEAFPLIFQGNQGLPLGGGRGKELDARGGSGGSAPEG